MASTVITAPDELAYSKDPIFVVLETDQIPTDYDFSLVFSRFEIVITSTGPTAAQTLELAWPGGSITYTVSGTPSESGTNWPTKGAETLPEYADLVAEFLRQREDVTDLFYITREGDDGLGGEVIRITRKVSEPYALSVDTDTMSNVAVTASSVPSDVYPDNLRALVQVWTDTGNFNTDAMLVALHSPYEFDTAQTEIDIAPAFATLTPHLPDADSIDPTAPADYDYGHATSAYQKYHFRHADKSGSPAVAQALLKSDDTYTAILGSRSRYAVTSGVTRLCHAYVRRDGANFRKPVSETQPDWVYWLANQNEFQTKLHIDILIYWSDGTQSVYRPWGITGQDVVIGQLYWFASGFRQMQLHLATPSGGTDPEAYIVAYDWRLGPSDEGGNFILTVRYDVDWRCHPWNYYLLFANGLGGCESVRLHGKGARGYEPATEIFERQYGSDRAVSDGDLKIFNAQGRATWDLSTGWYADPFYLDHLRQLGLSEAWLIDVDQQRFLPVIVEPRAVTTYQDDEPLHAMEFTVKSAWIDQASNI